MLLSRGANTDIRNHLGEAPADVASADTAVLLPRKATLQVSPLRKQVAGLLSRAARVTKVYARDQAIFADRKAWVEHEGFVLEGKLQGPKDFELLGLIG